MADKPWKQFERWIASLFTTARNSLSGGNSKMTRSDSLHPHLFISCKYTRKNHKQVRDLLKEEREKAEAEGKTALLAIGEFNDRANTFLVVHIQDFEHLTGLIKDGKVVVSPQKRSQRKRT